MKPLMFALLFMVSVSASGQRQKIVELITDAQFKLYGGSSHKGGGRIIIPIENIPPNTTELTYSVYTNKRATARNQRGNDIVASFVPYAEHPPKLVQPIGIYLLPDARNAQIFGRKDDSVWNHYPDPDNEHCMNCKVFVPWPQKGYTHPYLGIENPLARSKVKVVVNVTAIIGE